MFAVNVFSLFLLQIYQQAVRPCEQNMPQRSFYCTYRPTFVHHKRLADTHAAGELCPLLCQYVVNIIARVYTLSDYHIQYPVVPQ